MPGMLPVLKETDPVLIPGLLRVWGVPETGPDRDDRLKALAAAMEDPGRVETMWASLTDDQRSAMQMIYHTPSRSLPSAQFERVAGAIRPMGSDEIARQNPAQRPQGAAEALFYRGLISLRRENASTGLRTVLFIPSPLAALLPIHQTSYDQLDDEPLDAAGEMAQSVEPLDEEDLDGVQPADTSVVDDLATLLAFLRLEMPAVEGVLLPAEVAGRLEPFLLTPGRDRLRFLVALAFAAGLVGVEGGRVAPVQSEARRWLSLSRADQVRHLAEVWRGTSAILDMANVPGLVLDVEAGTLHQYDPKVARAAVLDLLRAHVPLNDWWTQSEFVGVVREDSADFQRPNGDFNTWYIQDAQGAFLSGIAHWDQVEGALLEYLISGPMHWLGLADVAEDAARFNAYGRAFMGAVAWPAQPDTPNALDIQPDGLIRVSRKASRSDRYTVARFTTWLTDEPPYVYRLDSDGLERAAAQGITLELIRKFLDRHAPPSGLPPSIIQFLDEWMHGAKATVTLEQALVLRTTSEGTLDVIFNDPDVRRFFGARLGPTAVIVRADQWQELKLALGERGIRMEVLQ